MNDLRKAYKEQLSDFHKAMIFFGIGVVLLAVSFFMNSIAKYILVLLGSIMTVTNGMRLLFIKGIIKNLVSKKEGDVNEKKAVTANVDRFRGTFLRIGYLIAIMIILLAFNWREVIETSSLMGDLVIPEELEVDIPPTEQKKPPPPPPPPPKLEILDDEEIIEEEPEIEEVEIEEQVEIEMPDIEEEETGEAEIFLVVEESPQYPGGVEELYKYIGRNIRYPNIARENGVEGKVYINFVVEPTGAVSNVKVLRGIGAGCDEEAVRVVKSLPKWKPGKQRGKPVRVSYNLPITFKLN